MVLAKLAPVPEHNQPSVSILIFRCQLTSKELPTVFQIPILWSRQCTLSAQFVIG